MPHCTKCGAEVPATPSSARFADSLSRRPRPRPLAAVQPYPATASSGLSENAAACLSYALGWITGIIFYLIDRRPYVRFHAAQSIVTFGGLHLIRIVLGMIFGDRLLLRRLRPLRRIRDRPAAHRLHRPALVRSVDCADDQGVTRVSASWCPSPATIAVNLAKQ